MSGAKILEFRRPGAVVKRSAPSLTDDMVGYYRSLSPVQRQEVIAILKENLHCASLAALCECDDQSKGGP